MVDSKFSAHGDISGIIFNRYAQSLHIGRPNSLEVLRSK